jgi:hypothetical protein
MALYSALSMLLALKEMKDDIDAGNDVERIVAYQRLKPGAWDAARAAILSALGSAQEN